MIEKIDDDYLDYAAEAYQRNDKDFKKDFPFYEWFQFIIGLRDILNNKTSAHSYRKGILYDTNKI